MVSTIVPTLVVPYASEEHGRERTFSTEMEKAAILCLSEAKRKRPKILKGTSEEIEYIAKFYYPLWGIPWGDRCVVIDGLGLSSVIISHYEIPEVEEFVDELKRSSVSYSLFLETLRKHNQTFRGFTSKKEETMEGVIGRSPVLKSLSSLINQAETMKETCGYDVVLVPPKFLREEAERKAENLIGEWRRLHNEVEGLRYAVETLEEEMEHHKERVSIEIEQIWRGYEGRISAMRKPVDKSIKRLAKGKEKEIGKAALLQEKRLKEVLKEENRLQQRIEELKRSLSTQRKRRKDQRRKYPKRSTTRIDRRIESYKKRFNDLSKKISNSVKLREELRREGEETLRRIEEKYHSLAAKEMEKLEILEQSRNLEVSEKREVLREMEEVSSVIQAQIKQLMTEKTASTKELEEKTLPFRANEIVLIGVPFYLVQYRSPRRTRTDVYPPVTAASYDGILKKIKKAILSFSLEARIRLLLNPRWPELDDEIFANFKKSLEADPGLRERFSEISKSINLLKLPNFKEEVVDGMNELEAEGWLDSKEKGNILSIYAQ